MVSYQIYKSRNLIPILELIAEQHGIESTKVEI